MGRELEIFVCPDCGAENRVAWEGKLNQRTLPCVACAQDVYEFVSVEMTDSEGDKYTEQVCSGRIIARKGYFPITKGGGEHFKIEGEGEIVAGRFVEPIYRKTADKLERMTLDG